MQNESNVRVLLVEGVPEFRQTIRKFLSKAPGIVVLAETADAEQTITELKRRRLDVVVLDLGLEKTSGVELTKQIRAVDQNARVIVFTASDDPQDIFSALDAGADGYVLKGNLASALEFAIRSVNLRTVWLDPGIATQVIKAIENARTSDRTRVLPTGVMTIPLFPDGRNALNDLAESSCKDGVCMVDPDFIKETTKAHCSSCKLITADPAT